MKQLRERIGLRTVDVAYCLGIAESTVRNWEHGRSVPKFEAIKPLMNLYRCGFDELYEAVKQAKAGVRVQSEAEENSRNLK